MTDLLRQLRGYGEQLEAHMGVLEVEDVRFVRVGTGPVRAIVDRESPHRRRWLVAAAAGAAAVAVILLAVLLWPGGGSESAPFVDEGSTVPGTTLTVTTTTPSAVATTTTTTVLTTTAVPGIVAVSLPAEDASLASGPLVAVSAGEVWAAAWSTPYSGMIGHFKDGAWAFYRLDRLGAWRAKALGLAVAPDGTVWAATNLGVFSFDGAEWTKRFDGPAGAVAIDEGGTVWIGGEAMGEGWPVWLARWDGESWERLSLSPSERPRLGRAVPMTVLPGGEVWINQYPFPEEYTGEFLLRYDGATLEGVQALEAGFVGVFALEAVTNGDLWVGGSVGVGYLQRGLGMPPVHAEQVVVARFDGEVWTSYDWPFPDPATDMAVGPDGAVWFASAGTLASFDGTEWTTHIEGQGISAVDVAPDGTVWYADEEGLHTLGTP